MGIIFEHLIEMGLKYYLQINRDLKGGGFIISLFDIIRQIMMNR